LSREVIQFQRATQPLREVLGHLLRGESIEVNDEVRRYLRDVQDHVLQVTERLASFRELLQNILSVNLTMVSLSQNEQVKKISAWAAILFAPTLVGTVYGMNFDHMPELHWLLGYPFALALMVPISVCLFPSFRRRGWMQGGLTARAVTDKLFRPRSLAAPTFRQTRLADPRLLRGHLLSLRPRLSVQARRGEVGCVRSLRLRPLSAVRPDGTEKYVVCVMPAFSGGPKLRAF
jgi:hypothetical protein